LCTGPRTVYLTFDVDANQSGQHAAEQLTHRLYAKGIAVHRVMLPEGHDPNSFFVAGGDALEFQSLLEVTQP
jgi:predicted nuclease with TOPRIM domain